MILEAITVTRTVQVRQYEPLVMSASATVEVGDDIAQNYADLVGIIMRALDEARGIKPAARAQAAVEDSAFPCDPRD